MEKEVIEEEKKEEKKKGASVAAIIILVLIIIGFIVYIAYDKGYIFKSKQTKEKSTIVEEDKDKNKNIEPSKKENIDKEDPRFMGIYKDLSNYTYSMNRENGYNSFSDKDLATISIKNFKESDFEKTNEKDKDNNLTYYKFKGDKIIGYLKKYFSNDVTINKEKLNDLFVSTNVNFEGSGMQIKEYDKDKDEYTVTFAGIGGTSGPSPKITARKIISATKQEDGSIKVVEKAIYYTSTTFNDDMYFNIYSDPSNNYNIDGKHFKVSNVTNEKIDVNDYINNASTITHIFKLNKETGNYYFASSVIK